MPRVYQFANPNGRPFRDDWGIMSDNPILKALQPWQKVKRIDCAYKVPLPFKKLRGNVEPIWTPLIKDWPLAPGAEVKMGYYYNGYDHEEIPHVLTMHPIHDEGWSDQACYLGGEWVHCYSTSSYVFRGKRFTWYHGLRLDPHVAGLMCWGPGASFSL